MYFTQISFLRGEKLCCINHVNFIISSYTLYKKTFLCLRFHCLEITIVPFKFLQTLLLVSVLLLRWTKYQSVIICLDYFVLLLLRSNLLFSGTLCVVGSFVTAFSLWQEEHYFVMASSVMLLDARSIAIAEEFINCSCFDTNTNKYQQNIK